jgi:pyridoxine 4-dehydrogenase
VDTATRWTTFTLASYVTINRIGFGAMRITGQPDTWGEPDDPLEARRAVSRAIERGINFFDTADTYGPGVSERLIAEALHPYPPGLVIATKGGGTKEAPGGYGADGRPEHLRRALQGSLERLRLEQIALYQLHRVDPNVDLRESVAALGQFREDGLISHIGLCNVTYEQVVLALDVAPIAAVQNPWSLLAPADPRLVDLCEQREMAFIAYAPLGTARLASANGTLASVAARRGASRAQVAIAWLLHQSPVAIPIPGTARAVEVEENALAGEVRLHDPDLVELTGAAGNANAL